MARILIAAALAAAVALLPRVALAVGDDSPAPAWARADPDVEAGKAAIRAQNWSAAVAAFAKVVAKDPRDADAQNFLGYAYRKAGNLDLAFKHYTEALKADPRHRGAHEYIGEAYLLQGNLAKAKEHLGQLDKLCFFGCAEYDDLKKAIAEYEKKTKK
jgi:tetratricopeptide (TPR) repeat protein